jgi:leader peptidase (prepilin peptidase)/N-methyltransferase
MTMWRGSLAAAGAFVVMGWAAAVDARPAYLLANCVLGWGLWWLSWIDWQHMRLPDVLTLPLLACGLLVTWLTEPDALASRMLGALAGYCVFRAVGLGYRQWRGHEGLGQGDAKLVAAGGAWLGWQALPWVVLIAALAGLTFALIRNRRGVALTATTALPFGPALALAIWLCRLHGVPAQF